MKSSKTGSVTKDREVRPPNRIRNNELVRDAAVRTLAARGLEGTNFNSVSLAANLSNSVLRKRFTDIDGMVIDAWRNRCVEGFINPLNKTILSYLTSDQSQSHETSKKMLNGLFEFTDVQCASLEILAVTSSHDSVCSAVSVDIKTLFNQASLETQTLKAQYVFYFQFIIGTLFHFRGQLIDRDLLVSRLHQLLVNGIVPAEVVPVPEVDASYIRGSFVVPEQSAHHELMNACLSCVAQNGFANTTTKMIAKKALVSEGKLFAYFPTKIDLFLEAISYQIENGFLVNFQHITKWTELYGSGVAAAILLREYQRPDLDVERALQIECVRLSWQRPEIFDKRLKHINKALIDLGVEKIDEIGAEQDVELMLSISASTGAIVIARLDRDAFKLPYVAVTQKIYAG